ncbi:MAG TPA: YbhB/YbcL family Raf kinase inhibitor-like protein [Chitinophagaceae bacterium]|nr:YbhB/YbcL family Raf kinase inhibitor-like protein [Chitinophagaceae bacterium]
MNHFVMEPPNNKHLAQLAIQSGAFRENEFIPSRYTCEGLNISPSLQIVGIPPQAKSLAVIVDDPDAPIRTWVHWVAWNIPATGSVRENSKTGIQGLNDFNKRRYCGPCPPKGTHRYFFKVYALDCLLNLPADTGKAALEKAMKPHILASGQLVGLYKKQTWEK